jgi:hypothetical protein
MSTAQIAARQTNNMPQIDKRSRRRDRVPCSSFSLRGRYGQRCPDFAGIPLTARTDKARRPSRGEPRSAGGRHMKQSMAIFAKLSNLSVKTRLIGVLGML